MAFRPHLSNHDGALIALASANSIHAGYPILPDSQLTAYQPSSAFQPDAPAITSPSPRDVGAPTVTRAIYSNGWAAKEDWARHRALIKQLYLDKKKTLTEVMRLMESRHGFKATVKMYKTHIKQWDLDRKNKEPEMKAIVRKNRQRADQGKRSIIRVRGQIRDFAEIVRYWNRKGVSIDDIIARHTASPTPEAVEFSTPVPSPIMTPQVLAIPESIFRCIQDYHKGSFESGAWVATEPSRECFSIKGGRHGYLHAEELHFQCQLACSLFSRNLYREAGQTLIVATTQIGKILLAEDHASTFNLFNTMMYTRGVKRDEIALMILRQFSAMGKVLLGSEHPLSRVCEWLTLVYASDFNDIIIRGMQSIVDSLESSVGPMHRSTIHARIEFLRRMTPNFDTCLKKLQKLLADCERTLQPYDYRTCLVRGYMAGNYFTMKNYAQAQILSQRNIACSQDVSSADPGSHDQCQDLALAAECQYALGEVDSGLASLHQTIDSTISRRGIQDESVRRYLLLLEDWYLEQGFEDSAAQVRERREKILESMETD